MAARCRRGYNRAVSEPDLRPVPAEEFDAFAAVVERAFGEETTPEDLERKRALFEPDRSLGAYLGDEIVGGTWALSLTMAVPGRLLPVVGVTGVGVSPMHRRRGILAALMDRQLRDVHERGTEAVAALWRRRPRSTAGTGTGWPRCGRLCG